MKCRSVLGALALLSACGDMTAPGNRRLVISVSPREFRVGDSVAVAFQFTNRSSTVWSAPFQSCPDLPFVVRNAQGAIVGPPRPVFGGGGIQGCDTGGNPLLAPGETLTWHFVWKPAGVDTRGDPLPPGTYEVEGRAPFPAETHASVRILP